MADKHIVIKDKHTVELLNKVKADIIKNNPLDKITDEITVKKALQKYIGENK